MKNRGDDSDCHVRPYSLRILGKSSFVKFLPSLGHSVNKAVKGGRGWTLQSGLNMSHLLLSN